MTSSLKSQSLEEFKVDRFRNSTIFESNFLVLTTGYTSRLLDPNKTLNGGDPDEFLDDYNKMHGGDIKFLLICDTEYNGKTHNKALYYNYADKTLVDQFNSLVPINAYGTVVFYSQEGQSFENWLTFAPSFLKAIQYCAIFGMQNIDESIPNILTITYDSESG